MFSLLTLQPIHSIASFDELAERVDIITYVDENFKGTMKDFYIPILNQINRSHQLEEFDNEDLAQLINPNHVFLADGTNLKIFSHALQGLPIKVIDEKLIFLLLSKFPIHTSNESDEQWVQDLKQSIQTFYENGFYIYGYQLDLYYYRIKAIPILRKLYREGKIDNNEFTPLNLNELMHSFSIILYISLLNAVVLIGEIWIKWLQ